MNNGEKRSRYSHSFFSNTDCEYFPCHEGVAKEQFNCLFCYCPLYALGERCGGNFTYTTKGTKSCVNCNLPHDGERACEHVKAMWPLVKELVRKSDTVSEN